MINSLAPNGCLSGASLKRRSTVVYNPALAGHPRWRSGVTLGAMTEPTPHQQANTPQPPPYGYYPPPAPFNTYSILALVLAIFVLPPLGIYFGYKARTEIAASGERGREFATAAIVIGWVLTGFWILWCGFIALMVGSSFLGTIWHVS